MNKSPIVIAFFASLLGAIIALQAPQSWRLAGSQKWIPAESARGVSGAVQQRSPESDYTGADSTGVDSFGSDAGGSDAGEDRMSDVAQIHKLQQRLTDLESELRREQASSLGFARQLDALERRWDELIARMEENGAETLPLTGSADALNEAFRQAHSAAALANETSRWAGPRSAENRRTDLQAAGVGELLAAEIVSRQEKLQLQELDLRDRAAREGWLESDEFESQVADLQQATPNLRAELGEEAYDRYLFTSGRPNRVQIRSVIGGSAADLAGIQVGDILIRYADQRIFAVQELQRVTRQGVRGESVAVEATRNNQRFDTVVERGPLGVTLGMQAVTPDS